MNARQARRNSISAQFATPDVAAAPVSKVNGLIHEELLAANSMILHELHFEDWRAPRLPQAIQDLAGVRRGPGHPWYRRPSHEPWYILNRSQRNTAAKPATILPRLLSPRRAAEVGQGC